MKKLLALLFVVIFASLSLVSCFFPDADKATEMLEDEDYTVESVKQKVAEIMFEEFDIEIPDCSDILMAADEDFENEVYVFYCESGADAKDFEAELNDLLEDEEYQEVLEEVGPIVVERSGKVVIFGTKKAVKILK